MKEQLGDKRKGGQMRSRWPRQMQTELEIAACNTPPHNRDAKSWKMPAFIDQTDELDSYLLYFECRECLVRERRLCYQAECNTEELCSCKGQEK